MPGSSGPPRLGARARDSARDSVEMCPFGARVRSIYSGHSGEDVRKSNLTNEGTLVAAFFVVVR